MVDSVSGGCSVEGSDRRAFSGMQQEGKSWWELQVVRKVRFSLT